MKKTAIVLVAFLSALISCGTPGEDLTRTTEYRIIKNTSSHSVDLTINANNNFQYQLDMGDSVIFEGYCLFGPASEYCEIGWDGSEPISGRVVFDNLFEIVYINDKCKDGRNPLNSTILWKFHLCGYLERKNNGQVEYIYEINDADYEMAVPIED